MATNNSSNYALGTLGQVLTMTSSTVASFANASNRSQSASSRSLNTVYQVSSTRDSLIMYSIDISCSLTLIGGTTGTVFLEMAPTAAFTTVQEVGRFTNSNSGTLTIGLNLVQDLCTQLQGYVPAGNYIRIRTSNVTGTPSFTLISGQEVLL